MFCPRCATQNSDDARYCRSCREDLKVIAQAMTRHLPVVLVSKVDEFIERRNERLRRDSVFNYLFAVAFLLLGIWEPLSARKDWGTSVMMFLFAGLQCGYGTWYMLAYRRSLVQHSKSAELAVPAQTLYCPRCSESNSYDTKFCRVCGENLSAIARRLNRRWPTALAKKLDRFIERENSRVLTQSIAYAFGGALVAFIGIGSGGFIGLGFILLACLAFVLSIWDIVVYKRSQRTVSAPSNIPGTTATIETSTHSPLPLAPPSVTEVTTEYFDQRAELPTEKL